MFDSKKKQLFSVEKKQTTSAKKFPKGESKTPAFVQAGLKKEAQVASGNGALKYSTTGNPFVDQFGKIGEYKTPRSFMEIEEDCEALWAADPLDAVKMSFYIRLISRTTEYIDYYAGKIKTQEPQRGGELKHEGIMRLMWLATKNQKVFKQNLILLPSIGSWKDIITMLQTDLVYHGWEKRMLPWSYIGEFILHALGDSRERELVKKYLPRIRANRECTTVEAQADNMIAKWICSLLFKSKEDFITGSPVEQNNASFYRRYRRLKTSGTAHEWQKLISKRHFDRLDFSKIHGRALSLLVRSKFLKNQKLQDKYTQWVKKDTVETVKFTGFVHELFQDFDQCYDKAKGQIIAKYNSLSSVPEHLQETINKQFKDLVNRGRGTTDLELSNLIAVRDTSSSMRAKASGTTMSSNGIAKALALYFSQFLKGPFSDSWIEFNTSAKMHQWKGNTPLERWFNDTSSVNQNTDFQSVVDLFCHIKRDGVPESDFPSGILCISDGEFDPAQLGKTNVQVAREALLYSGFSQEYVDNFVIVLWNIPNEFYGSKSGTKFETYGGDARNVFYFGGYSASTVAFLTSKIETPEELVAQALNQEILNLIRI